MASVASGAARPGELFLTALRRACSAEPPLDGGGSGGDEGEEELEGAEEEEEQEDDNCFFSAEPSSLANPMLTPGASSLFGASSARGGGSVGGVGDDDGCGDAAGPGGSSSGATPNPLLTPEDSTAPHGGPVEATASLLEIIRSVYVTPLDNDEDGGDGDGEAGGGLGSNSGGGADAVAAAVRGERRWRRDGGAAAAEAEASLAGGFELPAVPGADAPDDAQTEEQAPVVPSGGDDDDARAAAAAAAAVAAAGAQLSARAALEAELSSYVSGLLSARTGDVDGAGAGNADGGGDGSGGGGAPLLDGPERAALLAATEALIAARRAEFDSLKGWLGPRRRLAQLPAAAEGAPPEAAADPRVAEGLGRVKALDEKLRGATLAVREGERVVGREGVRVARP